MEFKQQGPGPVNWFTSDGESAQAALQTVWQGEAFNSNLGKAHVAASRIAKAAGFTMDQLEEMGIGDNAAFIRMAAAVADLLTPEPAQPASPGGRVEHPEWLRQAQLSEAYTNPQHADHERVSAEVRGWYEQTYAGDDQQPPV